MICKIANGAGFWGDNLDAPRRLVEGAEVDYLTLEYLAELTLSILARIREKDPTDGYPHDFLTVLSSLLPTLTAQPNLRIVTNAGGMNPQACAAAAGHILARAGLPRTMVGVVSGDDISGRLAELGEAGCRFENLETGQPLSELRRPIASANAYLGAGPIVEALAGGARLVITGRVADASLTLGPAIHQFGWQWNDWNRLAAGSVAGHLIECGAQVTGGLYRHWQHLDLANVGYPIAELSDDGACTITKPLSTGGQVSRETVTEQLLYEIGDPAHYLTPDVDVDFTTVEVAQAGPDRVLVRGATGRPAPENYKVSLAYRAGFAASGQLLVYGADATAKAEACAQIILSRLAMAGYSPQQVNVECLGTGQAVPRSAALADSLHEVMLRITIRDGRREAVERFAQQLAPLVTSGPPGVAGYAVGRPAVREVYAYWPTLVPKAAVPGHVEVRMASKW
ncbi:MAG TPA: acyclic terpene utilization AtuA family protein [Pirellulales bacterium]|nr:acyclic terpene utilization AtuA family protein [Pirellulales bacterium]